MLFLSGAGLVKHCVTAEWLAHFLEFYEHQTASDMLKKLSDAFVYSVWFHCFCRWQQHVPGNQCTPCSTVPITAKYRQRVNLIFPVCSLFNLVPCLTVLRIKNLKFQSTVASPDSFETKTVTLVWRYDFLLVCFHDPVNFSKYLNIKCWMADE